MKLNGISVQKQTTKHVGNTYLHYNTLNANFVKFTNNHSPEAQKEVPVLAEYIAKLGASLRESNNFLINYRENGRLSEQIAESGSKTVLRQVGLLDQGEEMLQNISLSFLTASAEKMCNDDAERYKSKECYLLRKAHTYVIDMHYDVGEIRNEIEDIIFKTLNPIFDSEEF